MFAKKQSKSRLLFFFMLYVTTIIVNFVPKYITCAEAAGNVFYVDFNYTGSENGSAEQPFNTMNKAVSNAQRGDTIYIREGIYNISNNNSGNIEVRNFVPSGTCADYANSEMLTITVDPAASGNVVFNAIGSFSNNSFFRITDSKCIHFNGDNRLIIDGADAQIGTHQSLVNIASNQRLIEDIIFERTEVKNSTDRGISFRQEIGSSPTHIYIRNNRIHDIDNRTVGGFGNTVYIEGNEIWNAALSNRNQAYGGSGWPGIVQMARRQDAKSGIYEYSTNIVVRNNIIHDGWGEGIIFNFTVGGEITGNTIHDVFSIYIYLDFAKDVIIDGNHLYRTTDTYNRNDKSPPVANGISLATESYSWGNGQTPIADENIRISNNIIDNVAKGVGYWHASSNGYATNSYKDISIFHNILRNLHNTPILFDDVPAGCNNPVNCQIRNNIIENSGTSSSKTYVIGDENVWTFSNNNWTGGLPTHGTHTNSHDGSAGFKGPDLNIGSDPMNYQLAEGSRNINAGTGTIVTKDYWGSIRDNISPSIGIHEYSSYVKHLEPPTITQITITR